MIMMMKMKTMMQIPARKSKFKQFDLKDFNRKLLISLFNFCRVSPRTPVTQNDPLGALNEEEEELIKIEKTSGVETKNAYSIKNNTIYTDQPILFRGQRSATFDESTQMYKSMQRSKTMPPSSVSSSFAGLGQTFKLSFG